MKILTSSIININSEDPIYPCWRVEESKDSRKHENRVFKLTKKNIQLGYIGKQVGARELDVKTGTRPAGVIMQVWRQGTDCREKLPAAICGGGDFAAVMKTDQGDKKLEDRVPGRETGIPGGQIIWRSRRARQKYCKLVRPPRGCRAEQGADWSVGG